MIAITVSVMGTTDEMKNYIFFAYCAGIVPGSLISYFAFNARQNHATSFEIACKNFKVDSPDAFNTWEVVEEAKDGENENRFWSESQVEIATRFLITSTDPKALEIADKIYLFGTKKYPHSSHLMVQYAIFFLVFKNDSSVAASYLKKAEKAKQMLIDTEFTIYQQQQEIKSGGATVGNKKLDAVDRVEFKQLTKEAKHYYSEARASIASFWLAIMNAEEDEAVDTAILMTHVSQMERSDHNATEAYNRLIQRYPLSVKVLSSYADFLDDIHNNHEESELIRRRMKRICDAGLSDDTNYATNAIGHGSKSISAAGVTGISGNNHMTKKSKKAYKEYRKQVYNYSRGNSKVLTWMIRDNGLTVLANAYTDLEHAMTEEIRSDIRTIQYAQIGILAFCVVCLLLTGFRLFVPVIEKAKTERETSLKAFLQIPRDVTHTLYGKYFDPDSTSKEDLNDNSDEDDEKSSKNASNSIMDQMKAQTGYKTMTVIARNGLLCIGLFFAASFVTDFLLLLGIMSIPGGIADSYDIPARASRINLPSSSLYNIFTTDISEILQSQIALLYGSTQPPHYVFRFSASVIANILPSTPDTPGTYETVSQFVDFSTLLSNTNPILPNDSYLMTIVQDEQIISQGYSAFSTDFISQASTSIYLLSSMAYTVWAIMVIVVMATYYIYWKRILNYLIKTENERTLKLLLMIPVEIVADIDSLRELLHLKRNTISTNIAPNSPAPHIGPQVPQINYTRSGIPSGRASVSVVRSSIVGRMEEGDEAGQPFQPTAVIATSSSPTSHPVDRLYQTDRRTSNVAPVNLAYSRRHSMRMPDDDPSRRSSGDDDVSRRGSSGAALGITSPASSMFAPPVPRMSQGVQAFLARESARRGSIEQLNRMSEASQKSDQTEKREESLARPASVKGKMERKASERKTGKSLTVLPTNHNDLEEYTE
ncbi:UNVERIFIED_CONTAM: hypothetical protein HDU68_003795 [Siphonaria sp. JEL0065]|nr:hypothetical protein HDU68_003795 [Siphonaria sp. JEL0065]